MAVLKASLDFANLPRRNSTDLRRDWKGVINGVKKSGCTVIYNHNDPEVVIISTDEYKSMLDKIAGLKKNDATILADLSRRFDERLSSLQSASAADKVDSLFSSTTVKRASRPKAGRTY